MRRRDLEHAFARYGQIKSLEYANGDPTAIITYNDVEDAVKARSKLLGTIQLSHGKVIRNELNVSPSSRRGKTKGTIEEKSKASLKFSFRFSH